MLIASRAVCAHGCSKHFGDCRQHISFIPAWPVSTLPGRRSPFRTWSYNPPPASTQQQPAGETCRLPILSLLHCSLFFLFSFLFLLFSFFSFSLFLTPSSSLSHNQKSNSFYTLSATPAAVFFSALCCLYFCIFHQGNRQSAAARRAVGLAF